MATADAEKQSVADGFDELAALDVFDHLSGVLHDSRFELLLLTLDGFELDSLHVVLSVQLIDVVELVDILFSS